MDFYKADFVLCFAVIIIAALLCYLISVDHEDAGGKGMGQGIVMVCAALTVFGGIVAAILKWLF